jgi:uncharacterized membrane protein
MKCTICEKDNESGRRLCAFCGAPLRPEDKVDAVYREMQRLNQTVTSMGERLSILERRQDMPAASPQLAAARQEAVTETPTAVETATPAETRVELPIPPAAEVWVAPGGDEVPAVVHDESPGEAVRKGEPPPPPTRAVPGKPREWEQILGGNWLARIGIITLIIGVAFFLKFAFDNNWLGPLARVILGTACGLALLVGGYYWHKKYPVFAQAISGGGIAILYLSIFAAFVTFSLMGAVPSVLLMLLVSVGSAVIALRYNSMALAILGILGAFVAPALLGAAVPPGDRSAAARLGLQLLAYVLVVDVGVLVLSTYRNWRWFTFLALAGSLVFFIEWYAFAGDELSLLASEGGLTLIFLIFAAATTLHHLVRRLPARGSDYALMMINAAAYLGISYGLMWSDLRQWMGGFSLLLALFYWGLAYAAFRRIGTNATLGFFAVGIAVVFLSIAIPVQLGDRAWTTVAWAAQAAVLVWLSVRLKLAQFLIYALCAFGLVAVRLLFFDSWLPSRAYTPVFNERLLAFLAGSAAMFFAAYFTRRNRFEKWPGIHHAFSVSGNVTILWLIGMEVAGYAGLGTPTTGDSLSLLVLLAFAAALTLRFVWGRDFTAVDIVVVCTNALALAIFSIVLWTDLQAWIGGTYLALAVCYAGLALSLRRRRTGEAVLSYLTAGIAVAFFTAAVPIQFGNQVWTTIAWAGELVVLMWLSFSMRTPELRNYSYAVFVLMAGQLLAFRTGMEMSQYRPIFNERFLVYLAGIAAAYGAFYVLSRHRRLYLDWTTPAATFLVAANFLTLWLLSLEVWDYFESQQAARLLAEGRSIQHLSLTALWALYAVVLLVIGIWRRSRPVRVAGLGLLALPIIKVFVYDVFALEQVYRIVAFVGLGVLLIASAYLYQRYSKAIRGFILSK